LIFRELETVENAKKTLLQEIKPIQSSEEIPLENGVERVLARSIQANLDLPHYHRAAMDGYALRAQDTLGATPDSPVFLELSDTIREGSCVQVHTGSPIPEGADAVVMLEDTQLSEGIVEVRAQLHPLKNIGTKGEDVKKGETVLEKGHLLRPCDIALLASLEIEEIEVFKKPRVTIIPTGNELIPRGQKGSLPPGKIRETNGLMAALYTKKWGGEPHLKEIIKDNPTLLEQAIQENLDNSDLLLICGGTSVGKRDYAAKVVGSLASCFIHGIQMSPGKPTALAIIRDTPVICLPGYPVACLTALLNFAKPVLLKLAHLPETKREIKATLAEKAASHPGYETYLRVKIKNGKAYPLMTRGAGILSSVTQATGYITIPPDIEGYKAGTEVTVTLLN